jgi:hypothetical protein
LTARHHNEGAVSAPRRYDSKMLSRPLFMTSTSTSGTRLSRATLVTARAVGMP